MAVKVDVELERYRYLYQTQGAIAATWFRNINRNKPRMSGHLREDLFFLLARATKDIECLEDEERGMAMGCWRFTSDSGVDILNYYIEIINEDYATNQSYAEIVFAVRFEGREYEYVEWCPGDWEDVFRRWAQEIIDTK